MLLAAWGAVSCGADEQRAEGDRLSAAETREVRESELAIRDYCRRVGLYLSGRAAPPSRTEVERVLTAADQLIALAEAKPDAPAGSRGAVRDVLGLIAEDLEGTNCSPDLARRLSQAFAGLPPRS
jgi:hypothetical protein